MNPPPTIEKATLRYKNRQHLQQQCSEESKEDNVSDDNNEILLVGFQEGFVKVNTRDIKTSLQAAAELEFLKTGFVDNTWKIPEDVSGECDQSDLLENLTLPAMKEILKEMFSVNPELVSYMTKVRSKASRSPDPSQEGMPAWCKCGRCQEMPTPEEQHCCQESVGECILLRSAVQIRKVVLNRCVLTVAVRERNILLALNDDETSNRTLRHAAYRQYIFWQYDNLAAGKRIVPSCVVSKIRNTYPKATGQYTGLRTN